MSIKRFIGIDPGINHPAMAVLDQDKKILFTTRFNAKPAHTIPEKLYNATLFFAQYLSMWHVSDTNYYAALELPEHEMSIRGQKCIDRNDFVKLCMSAGVLTNFFQGLDSVKKVFLYPPIKWKGQVPKSVTRTRLMAIYGNNTIEQLSDDQVDAIGLARFLSDNYET